jgi:hypothetical protein
MKTNRRQFLKAGAVAAVGTAAAACNENQNVTQPERSVTGLTVIFQFSGLLVHGRWPQVMNQPNVYSAWDALLVKSPHHVPLLKVALANVKNPSGFTTDRYNPDLGVWKLSEIDVLAKLDGVAQGPVSAVTGKRTMMNGKLASCPDRNKDDEYLDISWQADLGDIFGNGTLKTELKGHPKDFPPGLVKSRFRLPQGSIACARPTLADFEELMLDYVDTSYEPQFTADLTRSTSKATNSIVLELVPFGGSATTTIELTQTADRPVVVYVENHDPNLSNRVLKGEVSGKNFWEHHFKPYHALMMKTPNPNIVPTLNCCVPGCDPPFYCVPPSGSFA